ncbi:hypothetical protein SEA_LUMOS_54 [Mycobacterium phage Lumos]|uniref:Uncharacterized protein n=1 Tax=Mycobacterium phage Lumos TaxID=1701852 RepID=A0A0K2CMB8_9CAUD|nr:hypothetical protein AVU96_gp128 [Mycobacterium phage Snenia]YP_010012511.1 hypothetical protein J4T93_gp125 [Mycobacterium phage Lumos]ASM62789.1 hypothetical protein SEA_CLAUTASTROPHE_52 [Mycobacterium phage Clautastrophe]QDF16636.1 hypothetical protein PBI_MSGREEN_52 [Mycobacterium phage MsGreen]QPL14935.1 hypothetical protein SEA_JUBIE_52 [Mycobacterium phage Jubie]QZD99240.1 hypothetical protein SEA_MOOSTARD_52 [Mycobacterium phage Moostard]ALA06569.1 hypothetical protein SEA_LUMOS_54
MNLRFKVLGYTIASVELEMPESVEPEVAQPVTKLTQRLVKGVSRLWVKGMAA